jgi:GNAT superfamily N-acetyltransferase
MGVKIRNTSYDHPDVVKLTAQVQQEYAERYGEGDATLMDPAHFDPPRGLFLIGYLDGDAVVTGGWRSQNASPDGFSDGDAELKRMYVVPHARGRGFARRILSELEATAAAAGRARMVLETGTLQPEAIALYSSCGYSPIRRFGIYREDPLSVCLGKALASGG